MAKIENTSGSITTPHNIYLSNIVFDLYSEYNTPTPHNPSSYIEFRNIEMMICDKIGADYKPLFFHELKNEVLLPAVDNNKKSVVLGFSGGLDSVYQAIDLIERGYDVILYHLKNINSYENGQATKRCKTIASKLGLPYVESSISKKRGSQTVPENPFKNELIMTLMIDYCLEHKIPYISMGDDLNLSLADAVVGINVTDSSEITEEFAREMEIVSGVSFLPIMGGEKIDRIKKLIEYGLENDYYSCVQAGRFNKSFHDKSEKKYSVKLFDGNCGCYCRKCAMHNLLMHYSGLKQFPENFIDDCWRRMWDNSHSADYELFKPDLPLETRIKNLFEY